MSLCVYCTVHEGETKDHVIPQSFFPQPRPSNLITVPSCKKCQKKYKTDEEYIRSAFCFGPSGTTEYGKKLWEQKLNRALEKDPGLRKAIRKSFRSVDVRSPGGIYLGRGLGLSMPTKRLLNFLDKVIRGLFYFENHEALPKGTPLVFKDIEKNAKEIDEIIAFTEQGKVYWERLFEYRHRRIPGTFDSMWAMSFFRREYFLAFTGLEGNPEV